MRFRDSGVVVEWECLLRSARGWAAGGPACFACWWHCCCHSLDIISEWLLLGRDVVVGMGNQCCIGLGERDVVLVDDAVEG